MDAANRMTDASVTRSARAIPGTVTRRFTSLACALLCATGLASATLIRRLPLPDVVSAADAIVEGRVAAVRSFWEGKQIWTEVSLAVAGTHKGGSVETLTFLQLGGSVKSPVPLSMNVPGAPIHRIGDRGFYFLESKRKDRLIIVGLSLGHVRVRRDDRGDHVMFEGVRLSPGEFVDRVRHIVLEQQQGRSGEQPSNSRSRTPPKTTQ
jgi:hypothetical protein